MTSSGIEDRIRGWAGKKVLPPAYLENWLALDESSRKRLLEYAETLKMRTGQFVTALTLLEEIVVRESQSIGEILDRPHLRRILNASGSGPGRARVMLDELRALRYPELKQAGEHLAQHVAALKLPPGIKIVLPRELASDEVRVELIARGGAEMAQLLACLTAKSGDLVRLASMLSGEDESIG
jgi:hypothetical protein